MRGHYEKRHWEFCGLRRLFHVDCPTDGRWDDIAGRYGPCLPRRDLLSGKHAARLNSWLNTVIHPNHRVPRYGQGLHGLSRFLNEATDRKYIAQEIVGQLQEDVHKFR